MPTDAPLSAARAGGPPEDVGAEQSVLGSMLIEAAAIETAQAMLSCTDFSRPEHQALFSLITGLHGAGEPADLVTVKAALENGGGAGSIGLPYLLSLFDAVPTAANVRHYAGIVAGHARNRRLWGVLLRAQAALQQGTPDSDRLFEQVQADIERIRAGRTGAVPRRKPFAETVLTFRRVPPPPLELPYLFGPYLNLGAAHWLTGQNGIGKSTWLYNVLPALAEGRTLWDIPTQPTRVLYLDMESGELGRSLKAQRLYPERASLPALDNLFVQPETPRFPGDLPALLAFVQAERVQLVVFDTARRCFSVEEENSNSEFYLKIVPILDALKAAGVATLTMGHPPKNGAGARGAGAQEDAGDVNLTLTMHSGEKNDPGGILALRVTKNRLLGLDIPPLHLRRVGGDRFERVDAADAQPFPEATEREESKQERCRADLQDFLRGCPERWAPYNEITDAMQARGHSLSTAKRAHKELTESGIVARASPTRFAKGGWLLSEEG